MSRLPEINGRMLVNALKKAGFCVIRIDGSHQFLKHSDGRTTTIPIHKGESIGRGLLGKILRDTELTRTQLIKLLKS